MRRHFDLVVVLVGCCSMGFACSSANETGSHAGGAGGNNRTGGSTGTVSTGGSGSGGTTGSSTGGGGGSSISGQGGSATGGQAGSGSGGTVSGGNGPGGSGGYSTTGSGGTTLGEGGSTAAGGSGSGGKGTGGMATGGAITGGSGSGGSATGGSGAGTGGGSGGTSAGGGSGGTGGNGTDGGSASPVVPTKVSGTNKYAFTFGDVVFEVDAGTGARVATLSLSGTDMIVSSGTDNTTWGSVFWTSPRSAWTPQTWPPPATIDNAAYTGSPSGDHLLLKSSTDSSMGISVSKDYSVDAASGWITIVYTINANKAIKAAPWEDTRVPRGGLAFFPAGTSLSKGPLTMTTTTGINWFDDASKSASSSDGSKATADGSEGWSAYALNGILFLKKFADQPASAQVPGEGEICIYPAPVTDAGAGASFLEVEVQGPYTSIAAGANLPWTVQWRIAKIPSTVTVSAGSATLVDFARQQAAL